MHRGQLFCSTRTCKENERQIKRLIRVEGPQHSIASQGKIILHQVKSKLILVMKDCYFIQVCGMQRFLSIFSSIRSPRSTIDAVICITNTRKDIQCKPFTCIFKYGQQARGNREIKSVIAIHQASCTVNSTTRPGFQ